MENDKRQSLLKMREILFRGKVADEPDEWVYGYYQAYNKVNYYAITQTAETLQERNSDKGEGACGVGIFAVNPETVGQYTGLTDRNGKKIFEGDMVHLYGLSSEDLGFDAVIVFSDGQFMLAPYSTGAYDKEVIDK